MAVTKTLIYSMNSTLMISNHSLIKVTPSKSVPKKKTASKTSKSALKRNTASKIPHLREALAPTSKVAIQRLYLVDMRN